MVIPYTDDDPEYAATPLVSPIPPPSISSAPRIITRRDGGIKRGRGRDGPYPSNPRNSFQVGRGTEPLRQPYQPERRLPYDPSLFRQLVDHLSSDNLDLTTLEGLGQIKPFDRSGLELMDGNQFQYFKRLEAEYTRKGPAVLRSALQRSSPSYRVGKLMFSTPEGLQLANLDAALKIKDQLVGTTFLEISTVPGKFSEYLLWRIKNDLTGFGLYSGPVPIQPFAFIPDCQAKERYKFLNSEEWSWAQSNQTIAAQFKSVGVGLVIVDMISPDNKPEDSPVYQKHLLVNALLCLQAVQSGGSCLLKLAGITTELTHQVLWLLRKLFKQLSIIRPFVSGPLAGSCFVYFQNLAQDTRVAKALLTSTLSRFDFSTGLLQGFLNRQLVDADIRFLDFIKSFNHRLLTSRIEAGTLASKYVDNSNKPPLGPPTPDMQMYARNEFSLDL